MSDIIPLSPSLRHRFYEPLILLDALKSIYRTQGGTSEPDLEAGKGKSPKETYFCFVNKLSQICDSQGKQPLGKTVSAIAVLDSGTIEYRLASNLRENWELDVATEYLESILDILGRVGDDQVRDAGFMAPIFSDILRRVLVFNRPRVEAYMEALHRDGSLAFGITSSSTDGTTQGSAAAAALRRLQPHLEAARNAPRGNDDEFARHSEALLRAINADYEPSLEEYMKTRARGDITTSDSPWIEVRHALGRLLSYFIAIRVLISARKFWPQLFVNFEVTSIPSSEPQTFSECAVRRSAHGILRRMPGGKSVVSTYQRHAKSLQPLKLDERIGQRASTSAFHPIVHAEVNLLDSVLASRARAARDGDGPLRFFNEPEFGCYVGGSKPTCVLCAQYFAAHPSGVACRPTHGNLYYNWRAPDVYRGEGDGGAGEDDDDGGPDRLRKDILERMVKEVRGQAARALTERTLPRGAHDSRDTPSNPLRSVGKTEDLDLVSLMGGVNLDAASMRGWSDELGSRRGPASVDLASARGLSDGLASRRGLTNRDAASVRARSDGLASRMGQKHWDVSSTTGRTTDWAARMGQINLDASSVRSWNAGLAGRGQANLDVSSTRGCSDELEDTAVESPRSGPEKPKEKQEVKQEVQLEDEDEDEDGDGGGAKL